MAFTHKIGQTYSSDAGTVSSVTRTYTCDAEHNFDGVIATGAVNAEIDVAVTKAAIKTMMLSSTQAVTVKTNSSSSPQETINLTAGQLLMWTVDDTAACPFSADVTKMYVTNASGKDATFKFRALVDSTP
jgi:hypothetical protein